MTAAEDIGPIKYTTIRCPRAGNVSLIKVMDGATNWR